MMTKIRRNSFEKKNVYLEDLSDTVSNSFNLILFSKDVQWVVSSGGEYWIKLYNGESERKSTLNNNRHNHN
jgi:hypothetical protein